MAVRETVKSTLAQGFILRATKLDNCGRIAYGDRATVDSEGFVSVAASAQTNTVDAIDVQNARGKSIIKKNAKTTFTGFAVDVVFAEVDPELFSLVTGMRVLLDAFGKATGFAVGTGGDLGERSWALEVWAGATGGDVCDDEDAEGSYGYFLYPFLQGGILGDHTIENGGITFTITGAITADGSRWGVGPYDVTLDSGGDPGPLVDPVETTDHEIFFPTSVAPPEILAGARPLLDPAEPSLTTITPAYTPASYVVGLVATPDSTTGVWWDFGDGTWDFVDGDGDTSHTYPLATPHVYTARASSDGVWVSQVVTVPGV